MIVTEILTISGKEFLRTYSDSGYRIKKTGTNEVYDEAVDPIDIACSYIETEKLVVSNETEAKARAYDILMGER